MSYSDMVPGQEYHYRVRARTTEGVGKWSEAIMVKRPLKPEAPALVPQTAPPVDTKGKPALVATPNWFVQSWGKIWKPALLLMTICLWMIIIGLIFAAYVVIHNNHIANEILPAPSQKLVSNEELADSIARLATKDEVARLATTAQASPSTNVVVIGNNNIVDSVITSVTTSDRPQLAPTRIPEPRLKAEFTETRVIINPGYYQTYVPPREYNSIYNYSRPIVIPQPQVIYQQPQVIYQQSYPIGMIVRGQPGPWGSRGPGWHR
jgi:hypothetical protein